MQFFEYVKHVLNKLNKFLWNINKEYSFHYHDMKYILKLFINKALFIKSKVE